MTSLDYQYTDDGPVVTSAPAFVTLEVVEALTNGEVLADDERTQLLVAGAVAGIRRYCRWHIAPIIADTLEVAVPFGGVRLDALLPTHQLRKVLEVRVDGRVIEQPAWTRDGHVWAGYLGAGSHVIHADVHHGYRADEVADLVAIVAQVVAIAQSSPTGATREQAGALSVSWATTAPGVSGGLTLLDRDMALLDAYRIGDGP